MNTRMTANVSFQTSGSISATTEMRVAGDLRERILGGEFEPGRHLKLDEIAALLNVSNMPVRKALQMLEAEGIVEVYPHRGAVVRGIDARFVRNLYDIRTAIEVMLAERCAEKRTPETIEHLKAAEKAFENAVPRNDTREILALNLRFHNIVNSVADNPDAVRVLSQGILLVQTLRLRAGYERERLEQVVDEHRKLIRAIEAKNIKRAGTLTRRHCDEAREGFLSLLESR